MPTKRPTAKSSSLKTTCFHFLPLFLKEKDSRSEIARRRRPTRRSPTLGSRRSLRAVRTPHRTAFLSCLQVFS